ncbi:MAG TPA: RcpC/CpaB family pilus assembly protein [Mycobacteriales bacterium]|nr:RcpC/CpaB family pilus assembly protein [Mycobacteriales bacterium]
MNASVRWPLRGRCPAPGRGVAARWWLARHRRAITASCTALAVWCGLAVLRPAPPPTETVLTAARDLSAGVILGAADLRQVAMAPTDVPRAALRDPTQAEGHALAGPVRAGETLTDVRLAATRLLAPGMVAAPLRPADVGVVGMLRIGDKVDVLAAPASHGAAGAGGATGAGTHLVGSGLTVLALPDGSAGAGSPADGAGLVLVAASPLMALNLVTAAAAGALSLTIER